MLHYLTFLFASESSINDVEEGLDFGVVDMLVAVQPTQDAHLYIDTPVDWLEFEVQIQGWVPVKCDNTNDCSVLKVYADPFCETINVRITGLKDSGAFQYWHNIPCVDVPSLQPIFKGATTLPFAPPRRKWQ